MTDLLPCPFCGFEGEQFGDSEMDNHPKSVNGIRCTNKYCQATVQLEFSDIGRHDLRVLSVLCRWNRRGE